MTLTNKNVAEWMYVWNNYKDNLFFAVSFLSTLIEMIKSEFFMPLICLLDHLSRDRIIHNDCPLEKHHLGINDPSNICREDVEAISVKKIGLAMADIEVMTF